MFINDLKLARRNMARHKADTVINLVGLSVSFTCALLLFLSVYYEFSYDRFHKNAAHIFHLYLKINTPEGQTLNNAMPVPMTPALKRTFPEVRYGARSINESAVIIYMNKNLIQNLKFTDPDFFKLFSFRFLLGSAATALAEMNNVVLSKSSAIAVFGQEDPIGKIVSIQLGERPEAFIVSGVLADPPDNSSITFNTIIRFEHEGLYAQTLNVWDRRNHDVYIQLQDNASPGEFEKKLFPFVESNLKPEIEELRKYQRHLPGSEPPIQLKLQPLSDLHTNPEIAAEGNAISGRYLYLLMTVGLLIVVIACINFINISIGRSLSKSYEIGLRKTLGARPLQLIKQFWTEAFLVCLLSLLISGILFYLVLPYFKSLFGLSFQKDLLFSPLSAISVAVGFFLVTAIAGGYPAWLVSKYNIVAILKGKVSINRSKKLRNTLIVAQFSIAILLMICTLVSWLQIDYLRTKPLGFNKTEVISIPAEGSVPAAVALERLRTRAANIPAIESVSGIYNNLGYGLDGALRTSSVGFNYKNKEIHTIWMGVSYDFVKTLGIRMAAGRDFSKEFSSDSNGLVINEAMAAQLDEKHLIGTLIRPNEDLPPMPIIGVVRNFNFEPLNNKILPLSLVMQKNAPVNYVLVKVRSGTLHSNMELLKKLWKEVAPGNEFNASFLDDNLNRQYNREENLGKIFIYGTAIAIMLSCMGLFAVALLIVTQRIREIGIRKVLGASVPGLVGLVSKDFLILVIVAFIIAAPVSWFFMNKWLQDFAYRIDMPWWIFLTAGSSSAMIAFLTISFQAIAAAKSNPIKSLKNE